MNKQLHLNGLRSHAVKILVFATLSLSINIHTNGEAPTDPKQANPLPQESRLLLHLLNMDANQIQEIRETIQRIETMQPEEKQALAQRIQRLHDMPTKTLEDLRRGYASIPPEQRLAMRQRWSAMTDAERKLWREKMSTLTPQQRIELYKTQKFLPGHNNRMKHREKTKNKSPESIDDALTPRTTNAKTTAQ